MASLLESAKEIARESGAILQHFYERHIPYELKGEFDLVTEADRASEKLVVERLRARYPSHSIIGEEGGKRTGTSEYCWYVDPLDGTTNFAHGFPMFNVTLAVEREGELMAGVVYDPLRDEMFAAERGGGAYLNNRRIHVSKAPRLKDCLMATGFPNQTRNQSVNIHFYHQLAMATHGVRRSGSAAIDLAYAACGRLDAFWEFGLNPWDMAAGILLVQEAGGTVTDMNGGPHNLRSPHIVADNTAVHPEILQIFSELFSGNCRVPMPQLR